MLHSLQRRVERPLLETQDTAGNGFDVHGNAKTMRRPLRESLEDEQVKRPLQAISTAQSCPSS